MVEQNGGKYSNALGAGLDIEIGLDNESLEKYVVIDNLDALGDLTGKEYYEASFLLTSNRKIDLKADGKLLSEEGIIISTGMAEITDNQGVTSYIWPPYAQDSSDTLEGSIHIQIEYKQTDDGILLTKKLPIEWLKLATYPVITDATVSYDSGSGDGHVGNAGGQAESCNATNWDELHDCSTGWSAYTNDTQESYDYAIYGVYPIPGGKALIRTLFPFDLSALPDDVSITSASLKFYCTEKTNSSNFSGDIHVTQTYQANTSGLVNDDYDQFNWSASGGELTYGNITISATNTVQLNATGTAWINKTGYTKLGLLSEEDLLIKPRFISWRSYHWSTICKLFWICWKQASFGDRIRLYVFISNWIKS